MPVYQGFIPRTQPVFVCRTARPRRHRAARAFFFMPVVKLIVGLLAGLITGLLAGPVTAAPVPLTLGEAIDIALAAEPGAEEFAARTAALNEQSVAAGSLPDPTLRVGLMNFPVESGGFTTEGMAQLQLGLRQAFPPGNSRALASARVDQRATEMTSNGLSRRRTVREAVSIAWFDTWYAESALRVIDASRRYFTDLVSVTRSMYAVGRGGQADILRAEIELHRLDDRRIAIEQDIERNRAALGEWLGATAARRPLDTFPAETPLPPKSQLTDRLAAHPLLTAADARIAAEETGIRLAETQYKPGWAVDVTYGYRNGRLPGGEPRSDFASVMLNFQLPVFRKNRQDRIVASARQEKRAAISSRTALYRSMLTALDEQYARWEAADRRLELSTRFILPQSEAQARATQAEYQNARNGEFTDVMRSYIMELEAKLDHERLRVERARARARLVNLGGLES